MEVQDSIFCIALSFGEDHCFDLLILLICDLEHDSLKLLVVGVLSGGLDYIVFVAELVGLDDAFARQVESFSDHEDYSANNQ